MNKTPESGATACDANSSSSCTGDSSIEFSGIAGSFVRDLSSLDSLITAPPEAEVAKQMATAGNFRPCLLTAVWFGVFAGLLDGAELLFFQRINWEQWARTLHVSKQILWICPLVDVLAFVILSLVLATIAWIARRNALRVITWILAFVTVFDLLLITERLTFMATVLLATGVAMAFDCWWKLHRPKTLRFWSRTCRWLLALWLLAFTGIQGETWFREKYQTASLPKPISGTPNIILIVIDTLRADHLSIYGYGRATTPNLDRIAKQGVVFENAISASSWTLPSHASMLTGRYPSEHGMRELTSMRLGSAGLRGYVTLGEALEARGYRTGAFSANHVFFTSSVGLEKGFIHFEDYFQSPTDMFVRTSFGRNGLLQICSRMLGFADWYSFKRAPEVSREALQWIGQDEHPFFALLNYFGVHEADTRLWKRARPVWGKTNEVDRYDSALTYTDAEIGKLFQELERRGLTSNTLVVITSDHGQSLGQHHLFGHASALYLEQIHVPLIIWYPGHVPAGMRISTPVSNAAIAATIMHVATGKSEPFSGSVGLVSLWKQDSLKVDDPHPISELAKNSIFDDRDKSARSLVPTSLDGDMKSIVTPQWHLIEHQTLGNELYDWVKDPGELKNLINTPEGALVAHDLAFEMQGDKSP